MPLLLPLPPLSCLVARRRADGAGSRHLWPFLKPPSPPLSCCLSVVAPLPRICPSIHTQLSSSSWLCSCYKVGFDLESFASLVFLFGRTGAGSTHAFAFASPGAKAGPRNFDWRRPVRWSFPVRLFPHLPGNPKRFGPKVARKAPRHVVLTGEIESNHSNLILLSCLSISAYDRRARIFIAPPIIILLIRDLLPR